MGSQRVKRGVIGGDTVRALLAGMQAAGFGTDRWVPTSKGPQLFSVG